MTRVAPLLLVCLLLGPPLDAAETRQGRVLLLGDSISVGYTPQVRELLRDVADVIRPMGTNGNFVNTEGTTKGVKEIARWLQYDGGHWDVIHFNFGLHDLKRVNPRSRENSTQSAHPRQAEPDVYERQLREVLQALKATGARLILATTTPVPPGPVQPLRDPADVERYNRIAQRLAEEAGIPVNDLYSFSKGRLADWQRPVNVHFTDKGNQALADRVANTIRQALAQALGQQLRTQAPPANVVPTFLLALQDPALEVTLWAAAPMLRNPTNIDFDPDGRLWVAEGVNYRRHYDRQPAGDRIVILEDTDHDGRADRSSVFVQEPFLRCPMGIAVIDNQVVVSMAPDLVVYTDVNRDRKFDPAIDRREAVLTGFNGRTHDHTIHSVTVGPDGQWYWNAGNCGAQFTDRSGRTFRIGSAYDPYYGRQAAGDLGWDPRALAGQRSDDGNIWVGGFAARMNPDGSNVRIIGHNFRNSYEQTITSFGDVFQNDNDDPAACRTAFLMEGGNAGFCSFDGQRAWPADRRPGQSTAVAQWRQEDPGAMPAGDVYGGGAPTGIAFVEDSALGPKYRGLLLSCESARNTVLGYFPKPDGAGFKLERFDFLTSNPEKQFAGADFKGGSVSQELKTFFRPSDVAVGPDGAIYVSDFFDPRVGGHQDLDDSLSGAIYRIAPKDFKPRVPAVDLTTLAGAMAALHNPAVNVRGAARAAILKHQPEPNNLAKLLQHENPYVRARAIWLLPQAGREGVARAQRWSGHRDAQTRVAAFRSLRRHYETEPSKDASLLIALASRLADDNSPAVRREVALAMRQVEWGQARNVLVTLARRFDGLDRTYLEALGTGANGKEPQLYATLLPLLGHTDPLQWTARFTWLAWRLHPPQSALAFRRRALAAALPERERRAALTALAYISTRDAVEGIVETAAQAGGPVKADALWWLINRKDNAWKDYALDAELKRRGIYDPDAIELQASSMPEPVLPAAPTLAEVLALKGNAKRAREKVDRCTMCHRLGAEGHDVGPDLSAFGHAQTREVLVQSILDPSADIAHGFAASEILTTDGLRIEGLIVGDGNPTVILCAGGLTQLVPAARIKSKKPLAHSLMWTPQSLGLQAQDVADLVEYLRSL